MLDKFSFNLLYLYINKFLSMLYCFNKKIPIQNKTVLIEYLINKSISLIEKY